MTDPHPHPYAGTAGVVWTDLKRHLADRFHQLCGEMRHYPTPIARCDDQLPKLIEQRDHARAELERMRALDGAAADASTPSVQEIERFLRTAPRSDDDAELDLRARLRTAISRDGA